MMSSVCTVAKNLKKATSYLKQRGIKNARWEADMLLADALGEDRSQLYLSVDRLLDCEEKDRYLRSIYSRGQRIPLAYIRRKQPFRYLELSVEPGVFIPRPETEILVEQVISKIRTVNPPVEVVDLGTGSGAIALSLAYEVPQVYVYAGDISSRALKIARRNAERYKLQSRITFIQSELFSNFDLDLKGKIDVIVSNPPYIAKGDFSQLPEEVLYEPGQALRGGKDGLDFYRRIVKGARAYLKWEGYLAVEVGFGQAGSISRMFARAGFRKIEVVQDLSGIERVVLGRLEARAQSDNYTQT